MASCGTGAGDPSDPGRATGQVTVFAAASLTDTFSRIGRDFEASHPGTAIIVNVAGSSALATQIIQGAPADVFASASPADLARVAEAGEMAGDQHRFARNTLQIAVPRGNPAGVTGLADFGRAELKIALCAEQVPCGAASRKALAQAGVTAAPDTLEPDVRATLTKVTLGEVDAALVYRTEVAAAAAQVDGLDFPEAAVAVNDYLIAVLTRARDTTTARAFVDYVLGPHGQAVLAEAGFQPG